MSKVSSHLVAPHVLARLVDAAVRAVPGVVRLAPAPHNARAAATSLGVVLRAHGASVTADCYVVAALGANLLEVGLATQTTVAATLGQVAGVVAREVNIYIQDVEAARG